MFHTYYMCNPPLENLGFEVKIIFLMKTFEAGLYLHLLTFIMRESPKKFTAKVETKQSFNQFYSKSKQDYFKCIFIISTSLP